jgi:hypothetical protein
VPLISWVSRGLNCNLAKAAVSLAELHRNDAATSLKDEALDDFGVSHEKKRGEARASLKEQYDHWRPISGAFTLCNKGPIIVFPRHGSAAHHAKSPAGEEPAKAFCLQAQGSFIAAGSHVMPEPLSAQAQRLHTLSLVIVAGIRPPPPARG